MSRSTFAPAKPLRAAPQPNPILSKRHPDSSDCSVDASAANSRYGHHFSQFAVSQPPIQRQEEEEVEEEGGELQMKVEGTAASRPNVPVASGGGSALPGPVLSKMERSFGHSFSDVRIHSGSEAKQVGALAYTRGTDIHFQPGRYDPMSLGGQELLGHELTHVVQQRAGRVSAPQNKAEGAAPINADAGLEGEADMLGARAARGQSARVQGTSGGGLQRKVDVVQCWPWGKGKELTETMGQFAGYGSDISGVGTSAASAAQDWSGAANTAHSIATAPSSISHGDMAFGGSEMLGAFSMPGAAIGVGQGLKEVYKGVKTRDMQRGMEGAGTAFSGMTSLAGSAANIVQGSALLGHAASLAGSATAAAAPLALVTSSLGMGKSMYQGAKAQHGLNELKGISGPKNGPKTEIETAAAFAADMQRKKRNRAVLNTTSNGLIAGGAAATLAGAAGMGVGAAVGAGITGAGVGLKYGAMGLRNVKQMGRDGRERRDAVEAGGKELGFLDRTIGRAADTVFDFNTDKSSAKKKAAYANHTGTIMGNRDVGAQIFSGLGANKSDLKKFDRYHDLLGERTKGPMTKEDAAEHAKLEALLKERITSYMKVRE